MKHPHDFDLCLPKKDHVGIGMTKDEGTCLEVLGSAFFRVTWNIGTLAFGTRVINMGHWAVATREGQRLGQGQKDGSGVNGLSTES